MMDEDEIMQNQSFEEVDPNIELRRLVALNIPALTLILMSDKEGYERDEESL